MQRAPSFAGKRRRKPWGWKKPNYHRPKYGMRRNEQMNTTGETISRREGARESENKTNQCTARFREGRPDKALDKTNGGGETTRMGTPS